MLHTLAFAPTEEDLQEFFFDLPVITLRTPPAPAHAVEEPEDSEVAPAS